jgi:hypothetical protein
MLLEEVFVQLDRDARGRSARVGPFFISVSAIGLAPPPRSTAFYFGVGDRTRAATEEHRILFRCRRSDWRRHRGAPHFISVSAIGLAPPPRSTAFYFGVGDRTGAATEEHRIFFRCRRSDSRRHRGAPHFISVSAIGLAPPPSPSKVDKLFNCVKIIIKF